MMPVKRSFPGAYIQETSNVFRTITGVSTSITAFIGRAKKGPVDEPVTISSFADYENTFGGLWNLSTMSFAVRDFFQNGGGEAIIVRVLNGGEKASAELTGQIILQASSPGGWGNKISFGVDHETDPEFDEEGNPLNDEQKKLFNLVVLHEDGQQETYKNLSTDGNSPQFATKVVNENSALVKIIGLSSRPTAITGVEFVNLTGGIDGSEITFSQILGSEINKEGMYALEKVDLFNILCIPPYSQINDIEGSTYEAAMVYCKKRRAILLMDAPSSWTSAAEAETGLELYDKSSFAAMYFPRLMKPNPLMDNEIQEFAPCGSVAGIIAKTDKERGVWKAPAGRDAGISGVSALSVALTNSENSRLNPKGLNCIRSFPVYGNVIWGSRTWEGADELASEWKYLPVRRTALYIEQSLYNGLKWVVFEPNDENLWSKIRLGINNFLNDLYRRGAFQGVKPTEAYFLKCDSETITQNDINQGIVNVLVGFAPLKPAEFVILKIQLTAGQN